MSKTNKTIKAWIYLFPDDKKITDGQILFKRMNKGSVSILCLKEIKSKVTYNLPKHGKE